VEPDLLRLDAQLGRELVADREVERSGRLERPVDGGHPVAAEGHVFVVVLLVVVIVIQVTDVERRIGEHEVDPAALLFVEDLDAIARDDLVRIQHARGIVERRSDRGQRRGRARQASALAGLL
jgi:hypothetical protein